MDRAYPGRKIDNKYELISILGQGGLGTVYKAWQEDLGRFVAVKFLTLNQAPSSDSSSRFEREARVLANLKHKNIVGIYKFGSSEENVKYMAMEYLDGTTLAKLIADNTLDIKRILELFIQIARGLAHAHEHGIVHRDLKPQNIMIVGEPAGETVKILDFGLSRLLEGSFDPEQKLTQTGALIGSVHYMAPELCLGQKADPRTDIYSIGCILYECLTRKLPFDADHPMGILHKQINEETPRLPIEIPKEFRLITAKCLQKEREKRFQSAADLLNALELIKEGKADELDLDERNLRENKALRIVLPAILAVLAAFFGFGIIHLQKEKNTTQVQVLHQSTNNYSNPEYRRSMQAKASSLCKKGLSELEKGNMQLAADYAKRSILCLSQPFSGAARSAELARTDISLLKDLIPIIKAAKTPSQELSSAENRIRTNNEIVLTGADTAEFFLALSDLEAALGTPTDSYMMLYSACSALLSSNQPERCRKLLDAREKEQITAADESLGKPVFIQMGRVLYAKACKEKKLRSEINKAIQLLKKYPDMDELIIHDFYLDLCDACDAANDLALAETMLHKARAVSKTIEQAHPDRSLNDFEKSFTFHCRHNEFDKAELDLETVESFLKSVDPYRRDHDRYKTLERYRRELADARESLAKEKTGTDGARTRDLLRDRQAL